MTRLATALLASTALALTPAYGQTLADSAKPAVGASGFGIYSFSGAPGLGYFDGTSAKPKSVPIPPGAEPYGHGALSASTTYFPSIAAAATSGLPLTAPPSVTSLYSGVPYGTTIRYTGTVSPVQAYTEGGDSGFAGQNVTHTYLGGANRGSGAQSAGHDQAIFAGSGINGEPNADFAHSFSLVKKNWTSYTASNVGEGDVIRCDGRNGGPITGPNAGLSDMNCISINIQNTTGSGYLAGIEGQSSDVNPNSGYAIGHNLGFQLGIDDTRDGDYEGATVSSNNGVNTAAFHSQSSANGSYFQLFLKNTAYCANVSGSLLDTLTVDTVTGTSTWSPCPSTSGGAVTKSSFGPDGNGNLVVKNNAGTVVVTIDQGGNVSSNGTPIVPNYSYATLQTVSASTRGREAFCNDCLKPGEAAGAGTGMLVFSDGRSTTSWYTTAGTAIAH